ncbi:MAG: hydroxyisourate hydrolase [Chloroflexota bacterium]
MPGRLTTHVLDTAQGIPARNVAIELRRIDPEDVGTLLKTVRTNADGRTDEPLLADGALEAGTYELTFKVGDYFSTQDLSVPELPFLDIVPVRFGIADPDAHYHVPLLVSPWAYSTYRGS